MFEHYLSLLKAVLLKTWRFHSFLECAFFLLYQKVSTSLGLGVASCCSIITVPVNNLLYQYVLKEDALTWAGVNGGYLF